MTDKQNISQDDAIRYSRQILLKGFDLDKQERLMNSRVLLVGLGGLGCSAAQFLVASGVGEITLVDDDQVEWSNLQRQILHTENSLQTNKALSAQAALANLNSRCCIHTRTTRLSDTELLELLQEQDVIVDCSDNIDTRKQLNRVSLQTGKPLVSGAAIRMEGHVTVFCPSPQNPCYECFCRFFGEPQLSCVEAGVMSPIVGIIGAMQALEAIKLLAEYGDVLSGRVAMFDFHRNDWQHIQIKKQKDCLCHMS